MDTFIRSCSKCGRPHDRRGQRYCADCHAEYQREHRKSNGYAVAARQKKAQAIADYVWENISDANKVDPETLNAIRRCSLEAFEIVARDAGQRKPSDETRKLVLQILTERVTAARWGFHHGKAVA